MIEGVLKKGEKDKEKESLDTLTPRRRAWWSLGFALIGLAILVTQAYYHPDQVHRDPVPSESSNPFGKVSHLAALLFRMLGYGAWCVPWIFFTAAYVCFADVTKRIVWLKMGSALVLCLSLSILGSVFAVEIGEEMVQDTSENAQIYTKGAGGACGYLYSGVPAENGVFYGGPLYSVIGPAGSGILMSALLLGSIALYFSIDPSKWSERLGKTVGLLLKKLGEQRARSKSRQEEEEPLPEAPEGSLDPPEDSEPDDNDSLFGSVEPIVDETSSKKVPARKKKRKKVSKEELEPKEMAEPEVEADPEPESVSELEPEPKEKDPESDLGGFKIVRSEKTTKAQDLFPERKGDYKFPPLDLLMDPPDADDGGDEDHMKKAQNLRDTLAEFKIEVELGEVHTGPVITRYDVHPAAGVRVEKIANLDKNLAMALKAESVRILAPVPGKGCVGIEVPNAKASPVCIKEILESTAWANANAEIPVVLGKEASGKALVTDLTKMPHLLIAGSTGSGKTVCMNAIIASLCYHASPEDVRFIMVDPKIVEMKVYNDLPHMLIPVVTEPKKVPAALKWLLIEMERRYQIFAKVGVRNLAGFNAKILKDKEEKAKADAMDAELTPEERAALSTIEVPRDEGVLEIPENKLPYIVCIIDELADLMMVAQAEIETGIARLAQLARAAGIHLVIATQRPSVNVITGVIKANLPSRISFRVASLQDSRTILDGKGAEALIGKGDMLFIPPGSASYLRAQGAFVSDEEINGVVDFLKQNGPPDIVEEVQQQIDSAEEEDILGGSGGEDDDPMLPKALEVIRTTKRASTSNLQRKLKIGYNRAARIMDELEERGIVGPDNGAQPREILKDL